MGPTHLERAIASQPIELERLIERDFSAFAARLRNRERIWLVGTGTSQHAAEMGALLFAEARMDARWSGSFEFARLAPKPEPDDAVIVISQSANTAFAVAARQAAIASGAEVISITGVASDWPEAIETVPMEQSQTYTVSYTAALLVLYRLAQELGADGLSSEDLGLALERVRSISSSPKHLEIELPERAIVLVGNGPGAITAREGALKLREAARVLAEGYGGEYLLHGGAVPLQRGDTLILLNPGADADGLLPALGEAARAEEITVVELAEPSIDNPVLSQLPMTVQLQMLALRFSEARSTNPDRAIVGRWASEALWAIGRPA
jgi:glutamine---fructose-6-phosphate transaminase (isomerizing)